MIKIIKQGTRKRTACSTCGCVFSYEDEDIIEIKKADDIIGHQPGSILKGVNCPQCKEFVSVHQTK